MQSGGASCHGPYLTLGCRPDDLCTIHRSKVSCIIYDLARYALRPVKAKGQENGTPRMSMMVERPRPISHVWMDEKDRTTVWTPINRHEWPVPIPKDVHLNLIRIEMLNLGLEYTWLDILC
ncbi:hypothetical protein ARMSODRAFT_961180 [Armillaria solidipes]|uniref:Heterokaryon incompatibility domain-containing protein n=1 Tax=Armillaria solidipes TaxID=1076256 RepID=A0A2H3BNQ6_9AGAR|nr:hypothetical protein ARMSODRAFT_961180 [Armillaria solidipes]